MWLETLEILQYHNLMIWEHRNRDFLGYVGLGQRIIHGGSCWWADGIWLKIVEAQKSQAPNNHQPVAERCVYRISIRVLSEVISWFNSQGWMFLKSDVCTTATSKNVSDLWSTRPQIINRHSSTYGPPITQQQTNRSTDGTKHSMFIFAAKKNRPVWRCVISSRHITADHTYLFTLRTSIKIPS